MYSDIEMNENNNFDNYDSNNTRFTKRLTNNSENI